VLYDDACTSPRSRTCAPASPDQSYIRLQTAAHVELVHHADGLADDRGRVWLLVAVLAGVLAVLALVGLVLLAVLRPRTAAGAGPETVDQGWRAV
jgi:hypothetical protein